MQGGPLRSTSRWYLDTGLPGSVGFGPVSVAPPLARTDSASMLARDLSTTSALRLRIVTEPDQLVRSGHFPVAAPMSGKGLGSPHRHLRMTRHD